MRLKEWENMPPEMKNEDVKPYYDALKQKYISLIFKRLFDISVSLIMLIVLSPLFLILAIAVKADSPGTVFYRQLRVTSYGKTFRIYKFRTMVSNADKIGAQVTVNNDSRITRVGKIIRKCRLDEIGQLINVLNGTMTFVGVRPEVPKYVDHYTPEMYATLLLPAGVTSLTSIYYKDEDELLDGADDPDEVYIDEVLPGKMYYNLEGIKNFGFFSDIKIMFMTVLAVCGKEFVPKHTESEETRENYAVKM